MKVEALHSTKMLVTVYQSTWHKISKDSSLHLNLCDNQTTHNEDTVLCDIIAGKTRNWDMLYTVTIVCFSLVLNLTISPNLICNLLLTQWYYRTSRVTRVRQESQTNTCSFFLSLPPSPLPPMRYKET